MVSKWVITWVVPPPSNSDHQDYYIFSRESRTKPSFPLLLGGGTTDNPSYNLYPQYTLFIVGLNPFTQHLLTSWDIQVGATNAVT